MLSPEASVGRDVTFGAYVVVHGATVIGDGCTVQDHAVLGKAPARGRPAGGPLEIGAGTTVGTGAVVFAGTRIGAGCFVGDQGYVRERTRVGDRTLIGRGTAVDNDVVIGDRVSIQTGVYVAGFSTIEDDVFVGPCAMTTNDDTMDRSAPGHALTGATLRRACRIGGGAVLTPGVEVGEEAFVAAGAVVTRDVAPRAMVLGVPARQIRDVTDEELLERWR